MANDRDQSELTFEGMTARVGRFLSRVYRFPHDWGVPEPKPTDDDDAFLRKRLEELRIYGCSPVPDWMRRRREASHAHTPPNDLDPPPAPPFQGGERSETALPTVQHLFSPLKRGSGPQDRGGSPFLNIKPRLFRYDAKRLKRLISSAEHMIRCLIIWRAYRAMRDEDIKPRYHFIPGRGRAGCSAFPTSKCAGAGDPNGTFGNLTEHTNESTPSRCSCALHLDTCACGAALSATHREAPDPIRGEAGGQNKKHPPHPNFAVRGLPLYEPKAPPFRISMPMEVDRSSLRRQGPRRDEPDSRLRGNERNLEWDGSPERVLCEARFRENKPERPRNDDLSTHERLYLRLERLDQLYEDIDKRGRRLAARWAGEIYGPDFQVRRETEKFDPPPAPPFQGGERSETASPPVQQRFSPLERGSGPQDRGGSIGGSSHPTTALSATHREAPDPIRGEAGGQTKMLAGDPSRRRGNITEQKYKIRPLKSHDPPSDLLETTDEDEAEDLHILHDVAIRTAGEFHLLCG